MRKISSLIHTACGQVKGIGAIDIQEAHTLLKRYFTDRMSLTTSLFLLLFFFLFTLSTQLSNWSANGALFAHLSSKKGRQPGQTWSYSQTTFFF